MNELVILKNRRTNMFKQELKSLFTNRKMLISIIAILFIPILYSGMFLWAFWDPYDRLEDLPVAIVNSDTGAELDGEKYELGNEFVDKLKESKEFSFQFVDKKTGYKNLKNQKYYLLVEIPESFSENATTLMNEHPEKLELKYVPNESFNFLSAQIGETAIEKIKGALSVKVTETYAETMFENLTKMADGFQAADEGAGKLKSGIDEVNDGANTLQEKLTLLAEKQVQFKEGTTKVSSGTQELESGAKTLADGLGKLTEGQTQLLDGAVKAEDGTKSLQSGITQASQGIKTAEEKMGQIVTGTKDIKAGSDTLTSSLNQFAEGAGSASKGAADVKNGVAALQSQLEPVMAALPAENQAALKEAFAQLNAGTAKLETGNQTLAASAVKIADGSASLSQNVGKLNEGQIAMQQGLQQLNDGGAQLQSGAGELAAGQSKLTAGLVTFGEKLNEAKAGGNALAAGANTLNTGVTQLSDGSKQLADGSVQLADGSSKIASGTTKLADGSKELKDKLNDAAKESSEVKANDETYNMVAEPVEVAKESVNKVPNYGTGFTPYFLSLGLFVGALLLSIVFPLREPVGIPKNGFSWFISKFGVIAGVGIIQAVVASLLVIALLGIEVQSVPLFILFSIITSLVFITLIQLLVTVMGDPGRFIAIIILILQLTTSAGTFPLELIPEPLQVFNRLLPMTYSVRGFKEVISSGNFSLMWQNGYILIGYAVVFMLGTITYFVIRHKHRYSGISKTETEA